MKSRLLAISLLGGALYSTAQETTAPAAEPKAEHKAIPSVHAKEGKIVIETEVNGKKDTRVIDLADPATSASLQGKAIVTTEINGRQETRIMDLKDVDKMLPPFLFNERPPVRTGMVTWLGVATMEVPREVSAQLPLLPQETGLLIGAVAPDSPAAKCGLAESDVLTKLDDQILVTQRQLAVLIANHKDGDAVKLTYFRQGQQMETTATLVKHNAPAPMEAADPLATVTRHIWKFGANGKPRAGGPFPNDAVHGSEELPPPGDGSQPPAEHGSNAALRRSLENLPPEVRPQVEKALIESGALQGEPAPADKPHAPQPEGK